MIGIEVDDSGITIIGGVRWKLVPADDATDRMAGAFIEGEPVALWRRGESAEFYGTRECFTESYRALLEASPIPGKAT